MFISISETGQNRKSSVRQVVNGSLSFSPDGLLFLDRLPFSVVYSPVRIWDIAVFSVFINESGVVLAMPKTAKMPVPYLGDEPYIFLSYSHRNAEQANAFIRSMNRAGFRIWYDEGLIPGREWDDTIARVIMHCSYFIALLTEDYMESSNCKDELNFAREKGIPQLLIYLEDVALPVGMELRLGRLMAIHLSKHENMASFYGKVFDADGIDICRTVPSGEINELPSSETSESSYEDVSMDRPSSGTAEPIRRKSHIIPTLLILIALALIAFSGFFMMKKMYPRLKSLYQRTVSYQAPVYQPPQVQSTPEPVTSYEPDEPEDPNAYVITDEPAEPVPTDAADEVIYFPEEPYIPEEIPQETPAEPEPTPAEELIVEPVPESPPEEQTVSVEEVPSIDESTVLETPSEPETAQVPETSEDVEVTPTPEIPADEVPAEN